MDPYIEDPTRWTGFHDRLISHLAEEIQRSLPETYYAEVQDRVYLQEPERWIVPDIRLSERPEEHSGATRPAGERGTGAIIVEVPRFEVREPYIEIRDNRTGDRVVTVIEVPSPENKTKGGEGADLYRAKQRDLLRSSTNLVEIDLLRGGDHVASVPLARLAPRRPFHYLVVVRRGSDPERREVYPIRLAEPLPEVSMPLRKPDTDVRVDLQVLFERVYEGGAYWKRVDYAAPPAPPPGGGRRRLGQGASRQACVGSHGSTRWYPLSR